MKNFSRKLSLQWRLTLITALLVTITCILMYFFISQSAVTGMDHLQNYIVQINKTDSSPITFNIDPTILFPDLSEQVTTTKHLFQILIGSFSCLVVVEKLPIRVYGRNNCSAFKRLVTEFSTI